MIGKTVTDTGLKAIFKVVLVKKGFAYGFNMIDNSAAVSIPVANIIEISQHSPVIKKLCGDEKSRLNIADLFIEEIDLQGDYLGISKRQCYRWRVNYGLMDSQKRGPKGPRKREGK